MATANYPGSVDLISGIRPKNGGTFPLVDAHDVYVSANKRLDDVLGTSGSGEDSLASRITSIENDIGTGSSDAGTTIKKSIAAIESDIGTGSSDSTNTVKKSIANIVSDIGTGSSDSTNTVKKRIAAIEADIGTGSGDATDTIKKSIASLDSNKQNNLTFDDAPTASSNNPVKSGGVKTALDSKVNTSAITTTIAAAESASDSKVPSEKAVATQLATKQANLTFDSAPTASSTNPVTSGGVKTALDAKQNTLTFDNAPTASSNNPVKSGGVKTALDAKIDTSAITTTVAATGSTSDAKVPSESAVRAAIEAKTITVDNALSTTSENAVQNKVVKAALDQVVSDAEDAAQAVADDVTADYTAVKNDLNAKYNALHNGMVVSATVAGMTNHDYYYIYTGSETGYTAGHWYWWDTTNSAWTDGGPVGGLSLDTSLTTAGAAADAKATGDAITELSNDVIQCSDDCKSLQEDVGRKNRILAQKMSNFIPVIPKNKNIEGDNSVHIADGSGNVGITLRNGFDSYGSDISLLASVKYARGAIADKNGNILLDFAACQELDPTVYLTKTEAATMYSESIVNPLQGKKLSILGDSISTLQGYIPDGYAIYYPRGDIQTYADTWWGKLIEMSDMVLCRNASWSGSRVAGDTGNTSAYAGCSDKRIADLVNPNTGDTPDIIICYISTNDWANSYSIGSFDWDDEVDTASSTITDIAPAYALMLYKIRNTYPDAVVYCVTSLEGRSSSGDYTYPIINTTTNKALHEVNHAITEVAHIFGAKVIDLNICGIHYWNVADYMVDSRLHPNSKGTDVISKYIYKQLRNDFLYGTGL